MSPRTGKLVQYGKRTSTKSQKPHTTSVEPLPKRRKLMEEEEHLSNHPHPKTTQRDSMSMNIKHTDTIKTSCAKSPHTVSQASTGHISDSPHRTPSRTYTSKSKTGDVSSPIATVSVRPNTPTRSPSVPVDSKITMTPSHLPKNLSDIFAPVTQFTPHSFPSPGRSLTKRMLARSRTEPSLTSPSQLSPRSAIAPTLSLPSIIPTSPQSKQRPSSLPSPSMTIAKPHLRTYSQSRSFLVSLPVDIASHNLSSTSSQINDINKPMLEPDDSVRESYTDLRTRWGVDHLEDDPFHVPGVTNDLMSITELRSKGESRRFLDEVGYLFEGLEDPSMTTSVQRSSAAEIVLKMCDPEFVRKAKAADFISHAWDAMNQASKSSDTDLDPYLAFFAALVAHDKREVDDLVHKDGFLNVMLRLLQIRRENDALTSVNTSQASSRKAERIALSNLCNVIVNKSGLLVASVLSIRLLASYALSRISPSSYPSQMLPTVLQSLLTEFALLRPRLDAYTSGMALLPSNSEDIPDIEHIDHCLRIIDSFLLGSQSPVLVPEHLNAERENLASGLVAHCIVLSLLDSETKQHQTTQCIETALRVLINLSHLNAEWCKLLIADPLLLPFLVREILSQRDWAVKKEEVDEVEEEDAVKNDPLDRQCLALALLSNVVLAIDDAKNLLRDTVINPSCRGGRRCAMSCRCSMRLNAIECFVSFFVDKNLRSDSPSVPELDFFRCHLAALLCLLTFEDPVNQDIVRRALLGKTKVLSDSIQLFLEFYTDTREHVNIARETTGSIHMPTRVASALEALCT